MNIASVVVEANGAFLQMVDPQDQAPHLRGSRAGAKKRKDDGRMIDGPENTNDPRRVTFRAKYPYCGGVGTMCPHGVCSKPKLQRRLLCRSVDSLDRYYFLSL